MSAVDVALSPVQEESVPATKQIYCPLALCTNVSIVIYITVAGSVIPMRVLESDSVEAVKLKIQTCKGFVVKMQKLVFGGRELARNESLVRDYGVSNGNTLHLVLKISDLLVITVRTTCGKEFEFPVHSHQTIGYLKRTILKKSKDFGEELKVQELFFNGEKLEDQKLIDDITTDAVIHLVVQKFIKVQAKHFEKELFLEPFVVNSNLELPAPIQDMISSARDGLSKGNKPIRSSEGSGGAYFLPDGPGNKFVAIFKPVDEEPLAMNNPQGLPLSTNGEGLKRGTRVGEGAFREVAAFLLDHPKTGPRSLFNGQTGFSGVPPTVMVKCLHNGFHHPSGFKWSSEYEKLGSLQLFMKNEGNCEDMGPGEFPVEEVHKITVFDIRTANADRHAGNILVSRQGEEGRVVLTPIDHGYCIPENFEDCTFDWLNWTQARKPYSRETIEYIKSLDAEQDIALLKFYGWDLSVECARTLRISTMLLKKGVERGLTPFDIGSIMCRENLNKESIVEEIVRDAQDSMIPGMTEAAFLQIVSNLMDIKLEKLKT